MESSTLTSPFKKPIPFSCRQVVKFPTAGFSLLTFLSIYWPCTLPHSPHCVLSLKLLDIFVLCIGRSGGNIWTTTL
ncbi:hypothetical protein CMV_006002 [Castanea mollissima]|uniref:Uncharacterized protein n=1 Tax=Castanea mollissima TaxID=60419 RepID=A0A8J4W1B0_9ROSI|nr:hypothetical protein CMV_006002 [Castanea mollissima]